MKYLQNLRLRPAWFGSACFPLLVVMLRRDQRASLALKNQARAAGPSPWIRERIAKRSTARAHHVLLLVIRFLNFGSSAASRQ